MDEDDLQPLVAYETAYRATTRRAESHGVTGDVAAGYARHEAMAAATEAEKALRRERKARRAQRGQRHCLRCGDGFDSRGLNNRLCRPCATAARTAGAVLGRPVVP